MIPKIIHYCWFGGNSLPQLALKCIASWKTFFPDYEIKEWNENNYDVNKNQYIAEAFKSHKYAFVSDYARFDILYNYGGIYFDTDVEVIKDMSHIIEQGSFTGLERVGAINAGLGLAARPKESIYYEILNYYNNEVFIKPDGTYKLTTVVSRVSSIFSKHGFSNTLSIQYINGITIYPPEYFCPMNPLTGKLTITENTYTIHHYTNSWATPLRQKFINFQQSCNKLFGKKIGFIISLPFRCVCTLNEIGIKGALSTLKNLIDGVKS